MFCRESLFFRYLHQNKMLYLLRSVYTSFYLFLFFLLIVTTPKQNNKSLFLRGVYKTPKHKTKIPIGVRFLMNRRGCFDYWVKKTKMFTKTKIEVIS